MNRLVCAMVLLWPNSTKQSHNPIEQEQQCVIAIVPEGFFVGFSDGWLVGLFVGLTDGRSVGLSVGFKDGGYVSPE